MKSKTSDSGEFQICFNQFTSREGSKGGYLDSERKIKISEATDEQIKAHCEKFGITKITELQIDNIRKYGMYKLFSKYPYTLCTIIFEIKLSNKPVLKFEEPIILKVNARSPLVTFKTIFESTDGFVGPNTPSYTRKVYKSKATGRKESFHLALKKLQTEYNKAIDMYMANETEYAKQSYKRIFMENTLQQIRRFYYKSIDESRSRNGVITARDVYFQQKVDNFKEPEVIENQELEMTVKV